MAGRPARPRDLSGCLGSGCLQRERLATGQEHTVHTGHRPCGAPSSSGKASVSAPLHAPAWHGSPLQLLVASTTARTAGFKLSCCKEPKHWTICSELHSRPLSSCDCCLLGFVYVCSHGCYVSGLYLEGAAWDHEAGQLSRQRPRQVVDELPLLQVSSARAGTNTEVHT